MAEILKGKRLSICKTDLPPCCLRINPCDNSIIIVGTYKLEDDGSRHGSLNVYSYNKKETDERTNLELLNKYKTNSAILDIKFNPFDSSMLVSCHSTGNVMVWRYSNIGELKLINDVQLFDKNNLITSIFFSPREKNIILATLTSGESAIIDLENTSVSLLDGTHDLECWTGTFGEVGELANIVFTGGDDAKLIAHDLRCSSPVWSTNHRHHGAGVVSILASSNNWNSANPHHIWSGSYDDNLRIFDLRVIDKTNPSLIPGYIPKVLKEEKLGGGVWRLIPNPRNDGKLLSCCMYDGARIISTKDESFEVERYFKEDHDSMCYGGDWSSDGNIVATSSFYDNIIQVWSPYITK